METVLTRASESIVFGLKSTKKSTKVVKKRWCICSGRRSRRFESCHLDQIERGWLCHPLSICPICQRIRSSWCCLQHQSFARYHRISPSRPIMRANGGSESCHLDLSIQGIRSSWCCLQHQSFAHHRRIYRVYQLHTIHLQTRSPIQRSARLLTNLFMEKQYVKLQNNS